MKFRAPVVLEQSNLEPHLRSVLQILPRCFQYKPEETQPHMDKVRPSNLNSGFAGSDVGGRVIYFLPCLLACNLMVNPDLASEVLGWQKLHSALHPVQCCARSAACGEEWRSCRHFCSPGAGCDGLSRLHRTAIRQHFKFHLKPRDLVCMKKMLVHLKRF